MNLSLALAVGICSIGSGLGASESFLVQTQTDLETKQPAETANTPPELPDPPSVRLHPMDGFDDDAAYVGSIRTRVDALVVKSEQAADLQARVSLRLQAANEILAHQLEPSASRALLFLPSDVDMADARGLGSTLDRADSLLEKVASELKEQTREGAEAPTWLAEARSQHQTMTTFSAAIRHVLLADGQALQGKGARLAASALAPLREDAHQPVALAATLWQASLRYQIKDRDRAMSSLMPALARADGEGRRYALFSRLLRCRLVAEQGANAVALALLLQLEELSVQWLTDLDQHEQWIRTIHLLRIEILSSWYASMDPLEQAAERTWCVAHIERLKTDTFSPEHNTVIRLQEAIPFLTFQEDLPAKPPADSPEGE